MYRIKIDRSRCIGCLTCVTACVVSHETESGDARNRVVIDSETKPAPIFCRHCEHPECVYTCMTGAMKKDPETGYVTYDKGELLYVRHVMSLRYSQARQHSLQGDHEVQHVRTQERGRKDRKSHVRGDVSHACDHARGGEVV